MEAIDGLNIKEGDIFVDCTVGGGGHLEEVCRRFGSKVSLIGIDLDPDAIARASARLEHFKCPIRYAVGSFRNIDTILLHSGVSKVDKILFDLGMSSNQLEGDGRPARPNEFGHSGGGFSFQKDEPLDMRFGGEAQDHENSETAEVILNEAGFEELEKIFREYGEEKFSKEIAKKVLEYRKKEKITRTSQLAEIAVDVYKKKGSREKIHPATRIFQALRIAVNNEIQILKDVLPQAVDNLKVGGRVAVISFHSLEDRVVKHFFKSQQDKLKIITKKPISPNQEELNENRRARSAKLRVAEKI